MAVKGIKRQYSTAWKIIFPLASIYTCVQCAELYGARLNHDLGYLTGTFRISSSKDADISSPKRCGGRCRLSETRDKALEEIGHVKINTNQRNYKQKKKKKKQSRSVYFFLIDWMTFLYTLSMSKSHLIYLWSSISTQNNFFYNK